MARFHLPKRFSFSLRSLFASVAVVGVIAAIVVGYSQAERRFAAAQLQYEKAVASHDSGTVLMMDVCAESIALYVVDRSRWFRSSSALSDHVERLKYWEERATAAVEFPEFESREGIHRKKELLENIRTLRERFEKGDF